MDSDLSLADPSADSIQSGIQSLKAYMNRQVLGQERLISRMLVALLSDGHLLVEGAPGLAKTRAVKSLATGIEGDFQRIQFTPDLLPADLTGTDIYRPQNGSFVFQPGPLFHHIVIADEINRAPAKVQSALLEAMEEQQITVGGTTYSLPDLFFVMATQNPIEQEGTYPLPESQLDRFLLKVTIEYPSVANEIEIMGRVREESRQGETPATVNGNLPLSQQTLFEARGQVLGLHMAEPVEVYIAHLVHATRVPEKYAPAAATWIQHGASPRASLALDRCARALAWLEGRDYVSPGDVQQLAHEVLRHRIIPTYQAEAESITVDRIIDELLSQVPMA